MLIKTFRPCVYIQGEWGGLRPHVDIVFFFFSLFAV